MTEKAREDYKWVTLGIVTLGQTAMCFGALGIPPLGSFLSEAFALSKSQFGAIMSTLFLGAAIASFPSGRLADRFGVKRFLSFSMIAMGLLVILLFWTNNYLFLIITGFLLGLGYGTSSPATNKAVAEWFRRTNRGTAMSIKQTSVPLGSLLAALFYPHAALIFGWRKAFLVGGIIIALAAAIPLVFYRETSTAKGGIPDSTGFQKGPLFKRDLLMNKDLLLLSLIATIFAMVQLSVMTYLILYLEEVASFSVGLAGIYLGLASGSGLVGRICWGIISDRILGGRRKIVLQIIACISGLSAMLLSLYSSRMGVLLLLMVVLLIGFTAIGWNGIYHAYLVELVGKRNASSGTGFSLSIVFLGNVFGPLIFGGIVDLTGGYRHAWEAVAVLMLFSIITLFLLKEHVYE